MGTSIRNCIFAYRCDKQWSGLAETSDPDIKFCDACQREVFYCYDDEDLAQSIVLNRCVAIDMENHAIEPKKVRLLGSTRPI